MQSFFLNCTMAPAVVKVLYKVNKPKDRPIYTYEMARQVIMIVELQILGTQIFIYVIDYMQAIFRE